MATDGQQPDARERRAMLAGKRVGIGVIVVVAVAIIGASAVQIVPAIFGWGIQPIAPAPSGSPARTCADGIRAMSAALDRAHEASTRLPDGASSGALATTFDEALAPEWAQRDEVERACAATPHGTDAFADLLRLRTAEEELARRRNLELDPLRRSLEARLPR
jgi:hypothetical protein